MYSDKNYKEKSSVIRYRSIGTLTRRLGPAICTASANTNPGSAIKTEQATVAVAAGFIRMVLLSWRAKEKGGIENRQYDMCWSPEAVSNKVFIGNRSVNSETDGSIHRVKKALRHMEISVREQLERNTCLCSVNDEDVLTSHFAQTYSKENFYSLWEFMQQFVDMISKSNFVGNVIDVGSVSVDDLASYTYLHKVNPTSFKYPGDCLQKCADRALATQDELLFRRPTHAVLSAEP
ncbi:hypothetical protein EJ06DRAFT_524794 [Trichodelitschia bisporula]|uniref:Uncharacterized protein n=1 Tax=Trichodelitschia bisporula TaxID=703511 RepID=A0A6G1HKK8_9PEZI|nr:hypothetical protein EJ06DRAFT_524794 [Trichodelitschia bisporula]